MRADDRARARAIAQEVLREVPGQPLAAALVKQLGQGEVLAMNGTPPPVEAEVAIPGDSPPPVAVETPPTKVVPVAETPPSTDAVAEPAEPTPVADASSQPKKPKPEALAPKKKSYDALLSEGCKLVRSGKAEDGFEILKQAFDLNPNAVAVTVCMAEAHHELGRDPSARALCERALRRAPNDRRALLLAAELELARGDDQAALAHYEKILETHPDDAKAKAYVDAHGG
jgi:tetratricopeptide (TPR) repeat protein